ncbi:MAG: hypothetical protein ACRDHZ_10640 [Ktedonobacteraceae bacterium]
MDVKKLNPITWVSSGLTWGLNKLQPEQATPSATSPATQPASHLPVPASSVPPPVTVTEDDEGKDATIVRGHFNEQGSQDTAIQLIVTQAAQRTDQFRQEAESFDDEKAPFAEKGLRVIFTAFAYIVPITLAYFIGQAVGDAFTPVGSSVGYSQYAHFLSIALEMSLPILGFCVSLTFRRAGKDRSQIAICAAIVLLFLAVGVGNAAVQVFMVTKNIGTLSLSDQAPVYFRAGAPLFIDIISTLYLAIVGGKSLKRYLADKRAVMEAVRDISGVNILLEGQQNQAALNQMQAMMDMQSKQQRAATWNKLEALQAEKMVKSAEKAMRDEGDDDTSGSYRRRRY